MRMWMIDPKLLCRRPLLGEHGELHKHRHSFVRQHSMTGRRGQIEPARMQQRHDELAAEMVRRGYNHQSPYEQPDVSYLSDDMIVTVSVSLADLCARCTDCATNILTQECRDETTPETQTTN
jgi:hypothetical protein